jgi:hypothetical protein
VLIADPALLIILQLVPDATFSPYNTDSELPSWATPYIDATLPSRLSDLIDIDVARHMKSRILQLLLRRVIPHTDKADPKQHIDRQDSEDESGSAANMDMQRLPTALPATLATFPNLEKFLILCALPHDDKLYMLQIAPTRL